MLAIFIISYKKERYIVLCITLCCHFIKFLVQLRGKIDYVACSSIFRFERTKLMIYICYGGIQHDVNQLYKRS